MFLSDQQTMMFVEYRISEMYTQHHQLSQKSSSLYIYIHIHTHTHTHTEREKRMYQTQMFHFLNNFSLK
jgi:hypothetical protein